MPKIFEKRALEKNLLAILSGLMLTASFPPDNIFWMPWVALLPLFMALDEARPKEALKLGLLTGMAHYLTLIYWIVLVLNHYGNLNLFLSIGPYLLLCFYLSLFIAFFSLACTKIRYGLPFPWFHMACFWVALEYARAHFLTGLPWCLLGYSQYEHLNLIRLADITGVYGISFLIVLSNGILYALLFRPQVKRKSVFWLEIALGAILLPVFIFYGFQGVEGGSSEVKGASLTCAVIQPDIDQSIKWDPLHQGKTMDTLERLTRSTFSSRPRLIIWPETAVPFYFQNPSDLSKQISALSRESNADLLFGSPAYRRTENKFVYYNRAYLINPEGRTQYYDKVHLVPFGEYVPLRKLLFFAKRLVEGAGDFQAGNRISPLEMQGHLLGPLICFEAIFPKLARIQTEEGAEVLVNLTNDAWFGSTSAPYQHLAMAVFRAVENHRPMIRAANTGFSAFISPRGEILSRSDLFRKETLVEKIRPLSHGLTFYTRFGDVFALCTCGVSLWVLCWFIFSNRKRYKEGIDIL
ncbi:MAG: apolipoprotein N-acyltransferase [Desulfatiglandaceae bacterium]